MTLLDSGSERNAIDGTFLGHLKAAQSQGKLDKAAVSDIFQVEPQSITGVSGGMRATFDKMVKVTVTFRGRDGKTESRKLVFLVINNLGSKMLIGFPALRQLGLGVSQLTVELRSLGLELGAILLKDYVEHAKRLETRQKTRITMMKPRQDRQQASPYDVGSW